MKALRYTILLAFIWNTTLSCNPISRIARGNEIIQDDRALIKNMLIFPAYSNIDIVERKDFGIPSEAYSTQAEYEIGELLNEFLPAALDKQFLLSEDVSREDISEAGKRMIKSLKKSFNPKTAKVPDYLLQVLDERDQDYGLFIMQIGFTRTKENMVKEYLRRKDLGFGTLGFYDTTPYSSYTAMFGFLIDKKKKRVIRYKELRWPNKEPNDKYIIRSQVRDIILTSFGLGE